MALDTEEKIERLDGHPLPQVRYWLPSMDLARFFGRAPETGQESQQPRKLAATTLSG